jgi:hypothetical protein
MRKIIGVLVGVALVLIVGSANAANNGTGDPLGLIASAAIQPFYSAGPDNTLIEVDSPLDDNQLHVIYFNSNCARLISRPKFVSRKGSIIFLVDEDLAGLGPEGNVNGLAVIGRTTNNITVTPIPDDSAIHVRGHWFNLAQDFVRIVDPIAVSSAETGVAVAADKQTYSALRSAASFEAPTDLPPFTTTLHLICPTNNVYPDSGLNSAGFPPPLISAISFPGSPLTVLGFVYDDDENFIFDFFQSCFCSTMFQLSSISGLYGAQSPSFLTYTELVTYNVVGAATPPAVATDPALLRVFTGYRAINVIGVFDGFARLQNGAAYNYRNAGDHSIGLENPNFTPGLR